MRERNKLLEGKELVLYLIKRFNYSIDEALNIVEEKNLIDKEELNDLRLIFYNNLY